MNKIIFSSSSSRSSSFLSLFSRRKKLTTHTCFSHILPRCPQPCNTTPPATPTCHYLTSAQAYCVKQKPSPNQKDMLHYKLIFFQMVIFFYTGCYFVRVYTFSLVEVYGRPHDKQGLPICERDGLYSQSTQKF